MPSVLANLNELTAIAVNDYLHVLDTSDVTDPDKRIRQDNLLLGYPARSGTPIAGRVASWITPTTIGDGGFALSDIARLSQVQTYTGLITGAAGFRTGVAAINDDTFYQFAAPAQAGLILIFCTNNATAYGIGAFRQNTFMTAVVAGAVLNFTLGALTGTTGTDGRATVSMSTTDIYIENRLGAARTFGWFITV